MSDFRKSLILSVIPHVLIAIGLIVCGVLVLVNRPLYLSPTIDLLFQIHMGLVVIAIILWIIFRKRSKPEISRGIKWGTGIGIILMIVLFIGANIIHEAGYY
jgi:hypothetical protein